MAVQQRKNIPCEQSRGTTDTKANFGGPSSALRIMVNLGGERLQYGGRLYPLGAFGAVVCMLAQAFVQFMLFDVDMGQGIVRELKGVSRVQTHHEQNE